MPFQCTRHALGWHWETVGARYDLYCQSQHSPWLVPLSHWGQKEEKKPKACPCKTAGRLGVGDMRNLKATPKATLGKHVSQNDAWTKK